MHLLVLRLNIISIGLYCTNKRLNIYVSVYQLYCMYCTVLYITVLHCVVLHCITVFGIVVYSALYCIVLYCYWTTLSFLATIAGDCSTSADIAQVFVVHRRLKFAPFAVCKLDHSALILRTRDDKECVLEYLKDSKAHLYDAKPVFKSGCGTSWFSRRKKKCMYIMKVS